MTVHLNVQKTPEYDHDGMNHNAVLDWKFGTTRVAGL